MKGKKRRNVEKKKESEHEGEVHHGTMLCRCIGVCECGMYACNCL
jgi:hypothetical protein